MISYAQYAEDVVLWRALKDVKNGFYVDVGAMDPVKESVSKVFYEAGWSGINIDPVRRYIERFNEDRPRDVNLNTAVGDVGELQFHEVEGTGLSTLVKEYADDYAAKGQRVNSYSVPSVTLDSVFDQHVKSTVHFLKIDTEGSEKQVLSSIDLRKHRPWIIAVEATIPCTYIPCHEEWENLLTSRGYVFGVSHVINRFYVAEEMKHLADCWRQPIDEYRLQSDISEIEKLHTEVARLTGLLETPPELPKPPAPKTIWQTLLGR